MSETTEKYRQGWEEKKKHADKARVLMAGGAAFAGMVTAMLISTISWESVEEWAYACAVTGMAPTLLAILSAAMYAAPVLIMALVYVLFRIFWLEELEGECELARYAYDCAAALIGVATD